MAVRKIQGNWYVDFRHAHRRYRKRSPLNTKGGAVSYEAQLLQKLLQGESLKPEAPVPTFEAFAREWFDTYVKVNNKPSDIRTKESSLRAHLLPFFGRPRLDQIQTRQVEHFKAAKLQQGLKAKTVNNHLHVLSGCLRRAVEWELLSCVPAIKRLKTTSTRLDYLDEAECAQILATPTATMWHRMVLLALHTGMRLGELCGLDWTDLDLHLRQVRVYRSYVDGVMGTPKNHKVRHIPLTATVVEVFSSVQKPAGLVFQGADNLPLTYGAARFHLAQLCKRSGVRHVGWHVLRHTFASHLAMRGVPLRLIQELLGHSTITVTERYAHLTTSSLESAIAVLNPSPQPEKMKFLGNRWALDTQKPTFSLLESSTSTLISSQGYAKILPVRPHGEVG